MGNLNVKLTTEEFFRLRKELRNKKGIAPIVFFNDMNENSLLFMNADGISVECDVQDKNKELYIKGLSHYNKVDEPEVIEIKTHNFCSNSSWVHGVNNSLFTINSNSDKVIRIKRMQLIIESDLSFTQGDLKVAMWFSINKSCPDYVNGVITNFYATQQDPYWIEIPYDSVQEFTTMIHIDAFGDPEYGVRLFTYKNITDFLIKSYFEKIGNERYFVRYMYEKENIDLFLHGNKKERVECYVEGHTELSSGHADKLAQASFMFDNYNDW